MRRKNIIKAITYFIDKQMMHASTVDNKKKRTDTTN